MEVAASPRTAEFIPAFIHSSYSIKEFPAKAAREARKTILARNGIKQEIRHPKKRPPAPTKPPPLPASTPLLPQGGLLKKVMGWFEKRAGSPFAGAAIKKLRFLVPLTCLKESPFNFVENPDHAASIKRVIRRTSSDSNAFHSSP
jgi:hypothetical protein